MPEPSAKKRKAELSSNGPNITDPRFANIQSDPRYRLSGKKNKIKLDKRFARALQDEDFSRKAKVDRYGRPLEADAERKRLKRKYEFEEDEESDEPDDDDEVQIELDRVETTHDPLREGRDTESSFDEASSDEESEIEDVEEEIIDTVAADVPTGEVSSRLAVVNLDWDNIRAEDLMVVFSSSGFLGSSGRLLKVSIYPSEFGKERMEREEMEGPPKAIFAGKQYSDSMSASGSEADEDDEEIRNSILKPSEDTDFDSTALRQYQLERLRYFYAILTFSSPSAAKAIYDACDGTEYLSTANFFDLRFVPDDTDFSGDTPKEECEGVPESYKPNDFVTDALQHSKVKLTWDAENDGRRKEAVARAFRGGRQEIDENDIKAYLGTDSSDDEEEIGEPEDNGQKVISAPAKKEAERQKMRALLGLKPDSEKKSKKQKGPVGDIQITFSAGLSGERDDEGKKNSVFENSPEPDETTVEKYVRKEKERKQRRREKMKAAREGETDVQDTKNDGMQDNPADETDDLGFDDPFFVEPIHDKVSVNKVRKEERLKRKAEREKEEENERKQRKELELLMADDLSDGGKGSKGAGVRHFDMKEIERAEKEEKKRSKRSKKHGHKKDRGEESVGNGDDFNVNTSDPRFTRLFESHEYAIDPTNPRFRGTKAMKALLEEGRNRKAKDDRKGSKEGRVAGGEARSLSKKSLEQRSSAGDADVQNLVQKLKNRRAEH